MAGAAEFELTGGALCLDFANTLGDRPHGRHEHLAGFSSLVAFGRQAGLLSPAQARRLLRRAARQPRRAGRALRQAIALREALFRLFAAQARGRDAAPADLELLNGALARALPRLRLQAARPGFRWAWPEADDDLERVLWPVARSAAELLAAPERPPVRECASDTCSWLFLDHSRGGRRRWCDMKVCGNRDKARRHYRRRRAGGPEAAS